MVSKRPIPEKLGIERRTFFKGTEATIVGSMLSGGESAREREGSNAMQRNSEHPSPIAHRGFAGLYSKNTVAAMRELDFASISRLGRVKQKETNCNG